MLPHDPFGRSRLPADYSIEGRVALLGQAFEALMHGHLPAPEAAMFLGAAGMAWLREGGSLERDYFGVVTPKSHRTASAIWREQRGRSSG